MAKKKDTHFYSTLLFDDISMKKYLKPESFRLYQDVIKNGKTLTLTLANEIAKAMKD